MERHTSAEPRAVASSPPDAGDGEWSRRAGCVVIGRNEGERLGRALRAAVPCFAATFYVDSNSSDGSRELAASTGATVVALETGPYTPARGRKVGLDELVKARPELEFVQFIDGDCLLEPDWVKIALEYLDEHPKVGAVFGRRREERVRESLYSRLMDIDWEHPPGSVTNFGGDALVRTRPLLEAGSWSSDTINAEDIDASLRLRKLGYDIVRLATPMTLHDARMTRFGEYFRRAVRAGYGYLEVGLRYRHGPGRFLLRRAASALFYAGVVPVAVVVLAVSRSIFVVVPLFLLLRVLVVTTLAARRRGADLGTAVTYAVFNLICKAGSLWGSLRFVLDRLQSRGQPRDELIVYRKR
jgi:cellulose synthase/poly-beta-1,6-N-acetylglucosamine synthase-like glycosyltransferase